MEEQGMRISVEGRKTMIAIDKDSTVQIWKLPK